MQIPAMAMNRVSVLVLLIVASFCLWVTESQMVGGRADIPDFQNDKNVQDLAQFAVQQYNKQQNSLLTCVKVVKAQRQVVAGLLYYLTIEVKDSSAATTSSSSKSKLYEAKIWVKSWEKFQSLEDFRPVDSNGGQA